MVQHLFDLILNILFPQTCSGCGHFGTALCQTCLQGIPRAMPTEPDIFAVFDYNHPLVKQAIRTFKYQHFTAEANVLAKTAALAIHEYIRTHIYSMFENDRQCVFVPIPLHPQKQQERGFNQSHVLATWYIAHTPANHTKPHIASLLIKTKITAAQATTKNKRERLQNIDNTMQARSLLGGAVLNTDTIYVLIDDVYTTGATFQEAKRALREAGAIHIYCIALAHGHY